MSEQIATRNLTAPLVEAPRLQSLSEASCVESFSIQCAHDGCDQRLGYNFAEDESEEIAQDYARFQSGWDYTPAGLACPKHCVDNRKARVIR